LVSKPGKQKRYTKKELRNMHENGALYKAVETGTKKQMYNKQNQSDSRNTITKQDVKKAARDHITEKWQNRWNFSNRGRFLSQTIKTCHEFVFLLLLHIGHNEEYNVQRFPFHHIDSLHFL
jgi:hypothetical protein